MDARARGGDSIGGSGCTPRAYAFIWLCRWLRQQRTALHCHRDEDELRERIGSFDAQLNDDPGSVHARLRPKTRLDPREEKLRV